MPESPPFLKKDYAALVDDLLRDLADPTGGRVALTDTTEGSVVRTLVESFARELAVAYEQLATVYRLGYLESADGRALDQLVALVGLTRRRGGYAEGRVLFARHTPAPGDVLVPAGTVVSGRGAPPVETLESVVIGAGERVAMATARSLEPGGEIAAWSLDRLAHPLLGVDTVSNPAGFIVGAEETDDQLRARARFSMRRGQLGTCAGLEAAVRALGVQSVRVSERLPDRPGVVDVVIGDTDLAPQTITEIEEAIDDARPAGVRVHLRVAERVPVVVVVKPVLARAAVADDAVRIRAELEARVRAYLEALEPDQAVLLSKLRAGVLDHPDVREIATDRDGRAEISVTTTRAGVPRSPDGDLLLEGGRRAAIERVDVLLLPPVADIWVDLTVRRSGGSQPEAELRPLLDAAWRASFDNEFVRSGTTSRALGFELFKEAIGHLIVELVAVRATRSTTGQSVALSIGGNPLRLLARERLTLRSIEVSVG